MTHNFSNLHKVHIHVELRYNLYFDLYVLYNFGFISSVNADIEAINKFILYNSEATQPWVALYEQKRMKWDSDRKEFIQLNDRSMSYPNHLKENMPKICPNILVVDQVREKYGAIDHYPRAKEDALNIGIGCTNSVIIYLIYILYIWNLIMHLSNVITYIFLILTVRLL